MDGKSDHQIVLALARGESVRRSARLAGVSERTVRRRLEDLEFRKSVRDARADSVERASSQMSHAMTEAVLTLRHLLTAGSDSVRLGAARSILEIGCRLREVVELDDRLTQLEQSLEPQKQNRVA